MAVISLSSIFAAFGCRFIDRRFPLVRRRSNPPRLAVSSRLFSSRSSPSGTNGFLDDPPPSSSGGDVLYTGAPPSPRSTEGVPVFVTLPANVVGHGSRIGNRKAMVASLKALSLAGVEGVVVELWWGIVEGEAPGVYDWRGYADLVSMASCHGLKVRAIMAFHQCGSGPGDPCWIPLPKWVLEEMDKDPDLASLDRFGRRNKEYLSLGCDNLPVLKGRSPIQAYSDFMRSFRDTFKHYLGIVITEVQVGMGPAGELRYPSCPSEKLKRPSSPPELGEFQCYDKVMHAPLKACAQKIGKPEWGHGGPLGASNLTQNPEETSFFRSNGSWNSDYGKFFLEWYSGLLLLHGEILFMATSAIFLHTGVKLFAKVAGIFCHYLTCSHPSELTAGYYNTLTRDGYLPVARLFSKYKIILCCPCFEIQDPEELNGSKSSPESFLRQLVYAARMHNLPLSGEIFGPILDDKSVNQVIKNSKLHSVGSYEPPLSFNYVRMDRQLFDPHNWPRFSQFVRQMSNSRTFQAKVDFRVRDQYLFSCSATEEFSRSLSFY
ncbi:beta-amylase 1, chloroplastic-like [Phalaenopsis equestris]|uniref:beta-amylase 1, chloroplastic-like n=1 Tax=Phalaenopsis equestris TaxID=78828 RepID=UPI0009E1BAA4|nr:beta-amylase 1, chloroplastic-like [Phalaenopsis equestris]